MIDEELNKKMSEWKQHFSAQSRSGLSQSEYCRKNGLSDKAFYYWMRKVKPKVAGDSKSALFIDLKKTSSPAKLQGMLRIEIPGGVKLEVPISTSPRWIGELLAGLRKV